MVGWFWETTYLGFSLGWMYYIVSIRVPNSTTTVLAVHLSENNYPKWMSSAAKIPDAFHHFGTPETLFIEKDPLPQHVGTWLSGPENFCSPAAGLTTMEWHFSLSRKRTRKLHPDVKATPAIGPAMDYKGHVWKRLWHDSHNIVI